MKPEIRKRIEQIRHGEVPEGYKKTKAGMVPAEWEETHFREMFSRLNRKNTEGNTNVLTISAQHGLISQEDFFNRSIASEDKSNYFLLYKGEYAYNKSYSNGYPFGALKSLELYERGIVSPLYICFMKTERNKCPQYYTQYFEGGLMNREIKAFAQEGARNHGLLNISVDDFFSSFLLAPPLPEQQKIAAILATQDKVIDLQKKKIEELQKLKRAFLQKMFPKKGETVPEVRFPGFTEAWEQRKLGEILQEQNTKTSDFESNPLFSLTIEKGITPKTDRYERSFLVQKEEEIFKVVKPNEFVTNPMNLRFGALGYNKNPYSISVSGYYDVFSIDANQCSSFWSAYFKTPTAMRVFDNAATGSLIEKRRVKYSTLVDLDFPMPPQIEEKIQIGVFFDNLDNLITLHQRELEEMQTMKKALMQLLLTGIVRVKA